MVAYFCPEIRDSYRDNFKKKFTKIQSFQEILSRCKKFSKILSRCKKFSDSCLKIYQNKVCSLENFMLIISNSCTKLTSR